MKHAHPLCTHFFFGSQHQLHTAEEVKKWVPSITKEIDYILKVSLSIVTKQVGVIFSIVDPQFLLSFNFCG